MATDLSTIGGVRLGATQRNRLTPKEQFEQRFTPLVQGKTPNKQFDVPINPLGDALIDVSEGLADFAEDEARQRAAEENARMKVITDKEDDDMAQILEKYNTDGKNIFESADLSSPEGILEYEAKNEARKQEGLAAMDGRINEHRYRSKFNVDSSQQDAEVTKRIQDIKDERNTERATRGGAEYIARFEMGSDPKQWIGGLYDKIEVDGGSLEAHKKTAIFNDLVNFGLQQRQRVLSDPSIDPKLLDTFYRDPLTRKYMSQDALQAGLKARQDQRNRRYENSPEGQKARAEREKLDRFTKGFQEFTGMNKPGAGDDPNFLAKAQLYYSMNEKLFPTHILKPGEGIYGPAGDPIGKPVPHKPQVLSPGQQLTSSTGVKIGEAVPPEKKLHNVPVDSDVFTVGGGEEPRKLASATARVNPSVIHPDGSLTLAATKDLTSLAFRTIPKSSDIDGDEIGYTDKENNYMSKIDLDSVAILKAGAKEGMTTTEAHAQAILDNPDKPEKFDFVKAGEQAFSNIHDEPDATMELTAEGLKAFNDDLEGHLDTALDALNTLKGDPDVSPLDIKHASDIFSGIQKAWNTVMGNFSDGLVHLPTERARLNFALMARDFIRLFSLNPRFVVKEQILLEKIFSGPSIWTNTAQAKVQIEFLRRELDARVKSEKAKLKGIRKIDEKNEALDSLAILGRIDRRIKRFEAGQAGPLPKKGSAQAEQEAQIMAIEDPDSLTEDVAIELGLQDKPEESDEADEAGGETPPTKGDSGSSDTAGAVDAANAAEFSELANFNTAALIEALGDVDLKELAKIDIFRALEEFKGFTEQEMAALKQ